MKTPLLLILLAIIAAATPSAATAGTAGFDGETFTYTAAPGEANGIVAKATTTCGELAAPCFAFFDSAVYDIAPPPGCVEDVSLGILCPTPGRSRSRPATSSISSPTGTARRRSTPARGRM